MLLEGQIHIQGLGPEIAPRSRDPLESRSVNSGGESLSRLLLEASLQALKWKMKPKTGSSDTALCIGADANWTRARSSPKPARLENSLIPSQLGNSELVVKPVESQKYGGHGCCAEVSSAAFLSFSSCV